MATSSISDVRSALAELAGNLRWTWTGEFDPLFRTVDEDLWRDVNHNPAAFLAEVRESRLQELAADRPYVEALGRACASLRSYLQEERHWARRHAPGLAPRPVAYFSAEVGLHESLPIYSGGLGVLAGDHLKSCSDLGVPIWGVTILYRQGYFTQQVASDGTQLEQYVDLDTRKVPLEPALDARGAPRLIQMPSATGVFPIDIWLARIGRAHLLLLDGSRDPAASHRDIFSRRLYGGDLRTRLLQELILGAGGYRALLSLGVRPGVIHLNEGHTAFAILEAIAQTMEEEGLGFDDAAERVRCRTVFTTHTPVTAGHDRFPPDLIEEHLRPLRERLGLSLERFLALGRVNPYDQGESFSMPVLALRFACRSNAVSALHARTARAMWRILWPDRTPSQVPLGHVTNGVHVPTWIASEMARFFADRFGEDWLNHLCYPSLWETLDDPAVAELWRVKGVLRSQLQAFVERRQQIRHERLGLAGAPPRLVPHALTIGVARRFAEYKRASLLFGQPERLERLITSAERPVQFLFAGKAHPQDAPAKDILRQIVAFSNDPRFLGRIVVLENHDMNVARHLVQGCDLWLSMPRRPLEASGTSGQKALFNATLNMSVLDGWWAEAFDGQNGFAYGDGLSHSDTQLQDRRDAADLFDTLEQEVIPDYFERRSDDVPHRWMARVRRSLVTLAWRYNSDRMVIDYVNGCYLGAAGLLTAGPPGAP